MFSSCPDKYERRTVTDLLDFDFLKLLQTHAYLNCKITFVVFAVLLIVTKFLCFFLIFLPRRITVYHVKLTQWCQIIFLYVSFDVNWRVVSLFGPAIFFLHEEWHFGILHVPNSWINIFDEVLRPFTSLHILSVEAIILDRTDCTYLRMLLSFV